MCEGNIRPHWTIQEAYHKGHLDGYFKALNTFQDTLLALHTPKLSIDSLAYNINYPDEFLYLDRMFQGFPVDDSPEQIEIFHKESKVSKEWIQRWINRNKFIPMEARNKE